MCRIAGLFDPNTISLADDIRKIRDSMIKGGPDDSGIFIDCNLPLALGHRRLSILDLSSAGHQPMQDISGSVSIIYNGEIYNFREIRSELTNLGYNFETGTDTEMIINAYLQWGVGCLNRFNGMFALAIFDHRKNELLLARDHAGMKPLYYYLKDGVFLFASEIRAFLASRIKFDTEPAWESLFLLFGHIPEPYSTLANVRTLSRGTWMKVSLPSLQVETGKINCIPSLKNIETEEEAINLLQNLLPKVVERHLISDAPIGLFLSGGIDSSLLTLLAHPVLGDNLKTLSIHFEEQSYSEAPQQRLIAEVSGAQHQAFLVTQKDFEEALPDIYEAMDQPTIDGINTYFISMYASKYGLKAVLSGLGADELFGGYPSFIRYNKWQMLRKIPKAFIGLIRDDNYSVAGKLRFLNMPYFLSLYLMNRGLFSISKAAKFSGISEQTLLDYVDKIELPSKTKFNNLNDVSAIETGLYMKNQLLKDSDFMGMWHSLEIRLPFLDAELIGLTNSINPEVKFNNKFQKQLLVKAFLPFLPAEIWARKKQGFTFPFEKWLSQSSLCKPKDNSEKEIFEKFVEGKLHWSRYWALKQLANGRGSFAKNY